ncbi:AAA family ATPase [Qipengyuania sp. DSG2-2]|uniref:AAA family ATPase n=1 Tax=Qipengyuania sp. DGS2-2 TaxID=3349631 RepID=UPI0036D2E053
MTEHKKIPLPGEPEKSSGGDSSLFERASGAFGLSEFGPAPMPGKLADAPMKRARPVKRKDATASPAATAQAAPAPAPAQEMPDLETLAARVRAKLMNEEMPGAASPQVTSQVPATQTSNVPATIDAPGHATPFRGKPFNVDRELLRDQGLIDPDGEVSALLEEFRIVKRQVLGTARETGTSLARRILISSPHPDEGKTYCAVNLAIALAAEKDLEILLVDADFAKPSLPETLGIPAGTGFMDALADENCHVEDHVMRTDIGNLWVLPSGSQSTTDSEYLASSRTAEVLDRLTQGHPNRIVIFDTPPALAASAAAELAKHVGQGILVARADQTGRSALEDAYQLLSACEDIKLLLNATNFSPSGRRFGSYYQ